MADRMHQFADSIWGSAYGDKLVRLTERHPHHIVETYDAHGEALQRHCPCLAAVRVDPDEGGRGTSRERSLNRPGFDGDSRDWVYATSSPSTSAR